MNYWGILSKTAFEEIHLLFFIVLLIITTHLLQQGLLENIYNKI